MAVVVDPPFAIEELLATAAAGRRPHRARARDAHARRPCVRARQARARARPARRGASARRARVRVGAARRRRGPLGRRGVDPRAAHAGAPARALLLRDRRAHRADRRLAVRRRRRPSRSRGRRARGRRGPVRLAVATRRAAAGNRGLPRPRRGVALRRQHEQRPVVDDRPRARDEPVARVPRRSGLRARLVVGLDAEAADDRSRRRAQPRAVGGAAARPARAGRVRRGNGARRAHLRGARGRPPARRDQRAGLRRLLRHESRLRARAARVGRPARRLRRAGGRGGAHALGGRHPRARGLRRPACPRPRRSRRCGRTS